MEIPIPELISQVISRLSELMTAPLVDQQLLWSALPLLIATLFMTLYFGKYHKEELGWNTAFGNTMVFLFVALDIIQHLYYLNGTGSWESVFASTFYTTVTLVLTLIALLFMLITYYHLLPKSVAFFLFSAPPVNISIYVLMTIVYVGVPADMVTLISAVLFFLIILSVLKFIQTIEKHAGHPDGLKLEPEGTKGEQLLKKFKEKVKEVKKEKE